MKIVSYRFINKSIQKHSVDSLSINTKLIFIYSRLREKLFVIQNSMQNSQFFTFTNVKYIINKNQTVISHNKRDENC